MSCSDLSSARLAQLHPFERPRYFHGQLLDVRHFESEQEYFRAKLWLINRLVHGYGVVCGLDVQAGAGSEPSVVVTPGLALDIWGREIVVASDSKPVAVPPREDKPAPSGTERQQGDCCDDEHDWVYLVICYRECATGPEPVLSAGCNGDQQCTYGTTRESYWIPALRPGKAPRQDFTPAFRDPFRSRPFDYCALAEWVTRGCAPCVDPNEDTCVPLANIRRPAPGGDITEIDICVRPIVYGLDALFELMLAGSIDPQNRRGAKA